MIGVYITLHEVTVARYHEIDSTVSAKGISSKGIRLHTCFAEGDGVAIFDVWETREAFEEFFAKVRAALPDLNPSRPPDFVEMVALQVF